MSLPEGQSRSFDPDLVLNNTIFFYLPNPSVSLKKLTTKKKKGLEGLI